MSEQLNLPKANIRIKSDQIWDRLRKKYVKHTPEEWVRQHFIYYLIDQLNFPEGRMISELKVVYNGMNKRCDIAVFDLEKNPQVIVECKASHIAITENTFYQIAKYAHTLKAQLLIMTNGKNHYCAKINVETGEISYLPEIPTYGDLVKLIG
jgi:hypothetical protein